MQLLKGHFLNLHLEKQNYFLDKIAKDQTGSKIKLNIITKQKKYLKKIRGPLRQQSNISRIKV